MRAAALATHRRLPSCFGRPRQHQLSRGLAVEAWFKRAHREHVGNAFIPRSFVLPSADGGELSELALAEVAAKYRSEYTRQKLCRSDFEELETLGFAWCENEWKYEHMVVPALLKYKYLHGHMNVRVSFVVPSNDDEWPEETRGMNLGNTVSLIRSAGTYVRKDPERRQWLNEQGFRFHATQQQWEAIQRALLRYKELEGDMEVPQHYEVPVDIDWPEDMWFMQLGSTVHQIRASGNFVRDNPERRQWLNEQGFFWTIEVCEDRVLNEDYAIRWTYKVQPALLKYKELHGDMNVPRRFVVPPSDDWPENTWNMSLGSTAAMIRTCGYYLHDEYPERRQWLEEQGFRFHNERKEQLQKRWEAAQRALLQYKELHGDMKVTRRFVVPPSGDWPEEMWNMNLGNTVHHVRSAGFYVKDHPERRQWLEEQGFVWKLRLSQAERVRAAAKYYGRQRRGALVVGSGSD